MALIKYFIYTIEALHQTRLLDINLKKYVENLAFVPHRSFSSNPRIICKLLTPDRAGSGRVGVG